MTAKKTTVTEAMYEAMESRLGFLDKYLKEDTTVNATVDIVSPTQKKVDVLFTYNGTLIKAEAIDDGFYSAVDEVVEKVKKQLFKQIDIEKNNKMSKHDFIGNSSNKVEHEKEDGLIIKRKRFNMKPMSEEEAVLQMEMLKHDTFMFFHSSLEAMCLLYKKKHGKYGLIEGVLEE
jgi:ribosomal subunit interface protein